MDNAYLTNESTSAFALLLVTRSTSTNPRARFLVVLVFAFASSPASSDAADDDIDIGDAGRNIAIDAHFIPPDAMPNSNDDLPPGNINIGTFIVVAYEYTCDSTWGGRTSRASRMRDGASAVVVGPDVVDIIDSSDDERMLHFSHRWRR